MAKDIPLDNDAEQKLVERLRKEVAELKGVDRALVDPLLEEVAALAVMVANLRKMVQRDGVMIEVEKGGANNRHIELVENPALTAYSKHAGRLSDLAKKVSGFAKGLDDEQDEDELVAFNRR